MPLQQETARLGVGALDAKRGGAVGVIVVVGLLKRPVVEALPRAGRPVPFAVSDRPRLGNDDRQRGEGFEEGFIRRRQTHNDRIPVHAHGRGGLFKIQRDFPVLAASGVNAEHRTQQQRRRPALNVVQHEAKQRIADVLGRQRIARMKFHAFPDRKPIAQTVLGQQSVRHGRNLGREKRHQRLGVVDIFERDQGFVHVAGNDKAHRVERGRRVEGEPRAGRQLNKRALIAHARRIGGGRQGGENGGEQQRKPLHRTPSLRPYLS